MITKKLLIICCMAFLPAVFTYTPEEWDHLATSTNNLINGAIQPVKGNVNCGKHGYLFNGKLLVRGDKPVEVSVKVYEKSKASSSKENVVNEAEREYEIFGYLNAIKKPREDVSNEIKMSGVPLLLYRGNTKEGKSIIAFTRVDSTLRERANKYFESAVADENVHSKVATNVHLLLLQKAFTLKYLGAHGIVHYNIDQDNILFGGNKVYLFHFNEARKLGEENRSGITKDDGKLLLHTLCEAIGLTLAWEQENDPEHLPDAETERFGKKIQFKNLGDEEHSKLIAEAMETLRKEEEEARKKKQEEKDSGKKEVDSSNENAHKKDALMPLDVYLIDKTGSPILYATQIFEAITGLYTRYFGPASVAKIIPNSVAYLLYVLAKESSYTLSDFYKFDPNHSVLLLDYTIIYARAMNAILDNGELAMENAERHYTWINKSQHTHGIPEAPALNSDGIPGDIFIFDVMDEYCAGKLKLLEKDLDNFKFPEAPRYEEAFPSHAFGR